MKINLNQRTAKYIYYSNFFFVVRISETWYTLGLDKIHSPIQGPHSFQHFLQWCIYVNLCEKENTFKKTSLEKYLRNVILTKVRDTLMESFMQPNICRTKIY